MGEDELVKKTVQEANTSLGKGFGTMEAEYARICAHIGILTILARQKFRSTLLGAISSQIHTK